MKIPTKQRKRKLAILSFLNRAFSMCLIAFNICVFFTIWGVSCEILHTTCRNLNDIYQSRQTPTQISCDDPSRVLFISRLDVVCTSKDISLASSCANQSSSKLCFRSLPSDIHKSYNDYFTIAEKCNNATSCETLSSHYENVADILYNTEKGDCKTFCHNKWGTRHIVYYECITSTRIIDMSSRSTFNFPGVMYIQINEGTSASCQINGEIESSRILEQSNSDVIISSQNGFKRLCKDEFKSVNYNENLECLRKTTNINVNVTGNKASKFWLELNGKQLYVMCGDETIVSEKSASTKEEEFPLIGVIVGGILLVVISILVVIIICIKKSKNKSSNNVHYQKDNSQVNILTTSPAQINQDMNYNDANVEQNRRNDAAASVPITFNDDVYNTINETEGINVKETSPLGMYACTEGDYSDIDQVAKSSNMVQQDEETKSGDQTVTKPEIIGDVYAVVCKDNKLTENRVVGPQGDVYATVSNVKHHT